MVSLFLAGCVTRPGRDYGHLMFKADDYFQVQVVDSGMLSDANVWVDDLLLLPPMGGIPDAMVSAFGMTLWQELQQILPGRVRSLRADGRYAGYADAINLLGDDGRVVDAEIVRLGKLARVSHVLLPRIIDYKPYHPQSMVMEWRLVDTRRERTIMIIAGGLDVSEQRVLSRADSYLRDRKAKPYTSNNLDMLLRSPRGFSGFVVAQAVDAFRGRIMPATRPPFKVNGDIDDIVSELMEQK